jgi:hypothetical protein
MVTEKHSSRKNIYLNNLLIVYDIYVLLECLYYFIVIKYV